ncbi:hypothetical protein SedNR2807_37310 [Citrobacter sedlakii]
MIAHIISYFESRFDPDHINCEYKSVYLHKSPQFCSAMVFIIKPTNIKNSTIDTSYNLLANLITTTGVKKILGNK